MERKKYLQIIIAFVCLFGFIRSVSADEPRSERIYEAYIEGDIDKWLGVLDEMEQAPDLTNDEKQELIGYYYGYIGYLLGTDRKAIAKVYINRGDSLIDVLLEESSELPVVLAYKGSFLGFRMSLNRLKSVTLGPESMKYIKKAYRLAPENVQVTTDMANMLYYAPSLFGGDKKEALELYNQAVTMIERNDAAEKNWFYLNLLVTIAQIYESQKQTGLAIGLYEKILRIEPGFKKVRDELYPQVAVD